MGQSIFEFKHAKLISAIPIQYTMHVADMVAPQWISVTFHVRDSAVISKTIQFYNHVNANVK